MKNPFNYITVAIFFTFSLVITSCSSDDDNSTDVLTQSQVQSTIQESNWRITKFIDSGDDETYHFDNYIFTFNSSGTLTASNGTNNYEGIWSVTNSNSSSSSSDLDFNILFVAPPNFEELSDDWDILNYSANKVELIDVSGGNGGTDYLTFEKN